MKREKKKQSLRLARLVYILTFREKEGELFPTAMLVKELKPGSLDGRKWFYHESAAYDLNPELAEEYDHNFPEKIKSYQPSQEEFYIYSHSLIQ